MLLGLKLPAIVVGQNVLQVLQDALVIDAGCLLLLETSSLLLETVLVAALRCFVTVGIAVSGIPSLEGHA